MKSRRRKGKIEAEAVTATFSMSDPILTDLNPAQKEAVTWPAEKPLLVLAGAGSGKTRILTRRIAHFLARGIPSFSILGVTFTNKAAEEMRKRVKRLVRSEVWISTFHSACLRILREEGPAVGLPRDFTIYDDHDQLVLIKECLKELNYTEKQCHPKGARETIQRAKDFLLTPYQFQERTTDLFEEMAAKVFIKYEEKLTKLGGVDFGDLILKAVFLFDRKPKVLEAWQDRLRFVLIDEYQDTNHAQYRLVKQLASKYKQITVVGDPDQSIYGWRGADIHNILNFEKDYPEAGVIKMEQNYRSPDVILDAANALIQHNEFRKPKLLWGEQGKGERITLYEAVDEKDEAEFTIGEIQRFQREGRTLNEMAIFYRVHAQSRIFEDVLRRKKIPYKIVGGIRFYDRKEIKDLLAYLKAIASPRDDVSLKRILNVPHRGIGKKALELLEAFQRTHHLSLDETLRGAKAISELGARTAKSVQEFHGMMDGFRKLAGKMAVRELLEKIIEKTEYVDLLKAEHTIEAEARIENIEEFFSVIDDFEEGGREGDLAGFIESISLFTDLDTWDAGTNTLTLMTLHMAKGLEFPVVFMVGLEAGLFPNINSLGGETEEELEEERRLCYVGITRTQGRLYLSYASSRRIYGRVAHNLPSRFLTEIPQELLKQESRFEEDPEKEGEVEIDYDN
jgi:DNA helicase-2/ATP-dependent DNA helicase PcrA